MTKHAPGQFGIEALTKVGPTQLINILKNKLQEHRKMKRCEHVFNQLTDQELRDLGFYRYGNRFFPLDD
ncbi:HAD-IG family 5'-nucleotidase [Spartinivicinus ruber]|uniref:HAD-IG family 5'-nucleotidase n=1 Tax=Spartinivicinus ruber TaxID=2683272 RepID=UPI0013D1814E|nr:HAD-IG family 5'-nucleotidase [Spartinivicinus ruber]